MPAPKKIAKRLEGGGRGSLSTGGTGRKAVVKVANTAKKSSKLTPEEIKNIKAHDKFIKNNPDKFEKDPVYHKSRMKNDLEYQHYQKMARYTKKMMKEIGS